HCKACVVLAGTLSPSSIRSPLPRDRSRSKAGWRDSRAPALKPPYPFCHRSSKPFRHTAARWA
ncbi:MAG: hypothetical protein ACK56F_26465, partial [bacterium]